MDRLPALAVELVRRRVAVIFTVGGANAVPAAKAATTTIPIVFTTGANPVQTGMVASFNRPGGNVTGISFMTTELTAKRLGLLHELLPAAARFAVLVNPGVPTTAASVTANAQAAASTIGLQIEVFTASTSGEIDAAFASMVQKRADALLTGTNVFFTTRRVQFATLAARHTLPAIYTAREYVEAGGLMSYGANSADLSVWAAFMWPAFSTAKGRATCRSCSRPSSSSSSTRTTIFEACDFNRITRCLHRWPSMFASKAFTMCPVGVSWPHAPSASCPLYWCSE